MVDDNPEILDFLIDDLEEMYSLLTAGNGKEALEILQTEPVQLVVSDIMMAEMDGLELCSVIKSGFEYSHVPVILLTAKNTLQSRLEGLEIGADAYIEKPFSPEHLQVQIANLMRNREKIRDHYVHLPLASIRSMANTPTDDKFLKTIHEVIYDNLTDPELDVEKLAKLMFMSRPTLYRKIKSVTSLTALELIHIIRLKRAAELLGEGKQKIYEISDTVGFNSPSQLTRNFQKQFGMTPTEYVISFQKKN